MEYHPVVQEQLILCCQCGTPIPPNPANMCVNCIRNEVDITEGIPKQLTIHFCRNCERYLQPPNAWVTAELESRELLALCLKRLKGLSKVRLVDAGFIWTEPHSRRVKVKLTIQKEVFASTILQQIFEVEYVVSHQQCPDCTRVMAENTWRASVQVRQKVNHKRTFLFLEQLMLKHNAHKNTINIKETKDGLDFFFANKSHAIKLLEFLQAVVPIRSKTSEQIISSDIHTGTANFKFTFSCEIVPICKDDLLCLPPPLARSLGNIPPLVVCHRVGNSIHIIDPNSLASADISNQVFWRSPFNSLASVPELIQFDVLDVEMLGPTRGKFVLADVTVARSSDFGKNDTTFITRSHLGGILRPGDSVMGYDLVNSNFNDENFDRLDRRATADVILVRKAYPNRRKKNRPRNWKLKRIAIDQGELQPRKQEADRLEQDYELFLRDLEEDPELRQNVTLWKDEARNRREADTAMEADDEQDIEEEDFPEVGLDELAEDMEGLMIDDEELAEA
ncbi:uncharacterized protein VTP21DRAFT_5300 [Calcarisporiella thermophila]|uniref:uncharacterized protein n=1 Tax=Calcarisporiella thermophila TaxID=911321 RepID=UPI00374361FD